MLSYSIADAFIHSLIERNRDELRICPVLLRRHRRFNYRR